MPLIPDCAACSTDFLNKTICVPREAFNHLILYSDAQTMAAISFFIGIGVTLLWVIAFDRREKIRLWMRKRMGKDGI